MSERKEGDRIERVRIATYVMDERDEILLFGEVGGGRELAGEWSVSDIRRDPAGTGDDMYAMEKDDRSVARIADYKLETLIKWGYAHVLETY